MFSPYLCYKILFYRGESKISAEHVSYIIYKANYLLVYLLSKGAFWSGHSWFLTKGNYGYSFNVGIQKSLLSANNKKIKEKERGYDLSILTRWAGSSELKKWWFKR
jgi:hypothetical protein